MADEKENVVEAIEQITMEAEKKAADREEKKKKKAEKAEKKYNDKLEKQSRKNKGKVVRTGYIKFVQHIVITVFVVALVVISTGRTVVVPGVNGDHSITVSTTDENRKYEDSVLFNTIFGDEVTSILRLVTIREQIETDGKYDSDKIVDIIAYNNRKNISNNSETTKAKYYLSDLIKWSKYGFDYENLNIGQMSADAKALAENNNDGTGSTEYYDDPETEYKLLVNRYNTVSGQSLEACADSWSEYNQLTLDLEEASDQLRNNYSEYLKLTDYYDDLKSNMRYCVIIGEGNNQVIYSNADIKKEDLKSIEKTFKAYGRYIAYDYDRMIYSTNTAISESTFNNIIKKYQYSYPDDCKIYIAADMSMPHEDSISIGGKGFNNYLPYYNELFALMVISLVIYILLLIVCTISEGRAYTSEGDKYTRLFPIDDMYVEIWIIAAIIILFGVGTSISLFMYPSETMMEYISMPYFNIIMAVTVFVTDILGLGLFYSMVRRIKTRHIWKYTFIYKVIDYIKRLYLKAYDNGSAVIRSWIPFVVVIVLNIILFTFAMTGVFPVAIFMVIVLVTIDINAGIFIYNQVKDRQGIIKGMNQIISGDFSYKADATNLHGDNAEMASCVNSIGDSIRNAVEQSLKDEKMKADLIANVSHDIRTPLTSIINYVDLIKRENIQDEKIQGYIQVLEDKSQRLKTLTEDLIEASKVSSGNVELELVKVNLPEMLNQSLAEFGEKFDERGLQCICRSEKLCSYAMMADGKSLWRVMENLFGNIYKYAMEGTRVFIDIFNVEEEGKKRIVIQIKNISSTPLPEDLGELTERFIRGDSSRTTEGSGLGLSIAKSLTELMGGTFELASEADLFKVELSFETVE